MRDRRLRAVLVAGALVALLGSGAGVPVSGRSATSAGPVFAAGAAVAGIDPPLRGTVRGPRPWDCDPTGQFDGPRQFDFEEPYKDTLAKGHYVWGEPYLDCNGNGRYDGIFITSGDLDRPLILKDPKELEPTGSPALRTAVVIAENHGSKAIGPFYTALGKRTFEQVPPPLDRADMVAAVRESLEEAGLDPGLCDKALSEPATWGKVIAETQAMVQRIGKLGVPTIVLDGGAGPAIFGPVVSEMPADGDAVELWRHTAWLARYGNFAELKRKRAHITELPVMEWFREQRAKAAAT